MNEIRDKIMSRMIPMTYAQYKREFFESMSNLNLSGVLNEEEVKEADPSPAVAATMFLNEDSKSKIMGMELSKIGMVEEKKTPEQEDPDKIVDDTMLKTAHGFNIDTTEIVNVLEFQSPAPFLGKKRADKKMDLIEDCAICLDVFEDETELVKT